MLANQLIHTYPFLFHMAEYGSLDSIKKHGLLSITALLELFEITGNERFAIESCHRPRPVTIRHKEHGTAIIRDQKPMNDSMLSKCLDDKLTPGDWYRIINSMVFFWATKERLITFLSAPAHKDRMQTILMVRTKILVERHRDKIRLCTINSGCTRSIDHRRGLYTFKTIEDFDYAESVKKRRKKNALAEVSVRYSVPDIAEMIVEVNHVRGVESIQ